MDVHGQEIGVNSSEPSGSEFETRVCPRCAGKGRIPSARRNSEDMRILRAVWLSEHPGLWKNWIGRPAVGHAPRVNDPRARVLVDAMRAAGLISPTTYWIDVNVNRMIDYVRSILDQTSVSARIAAAQKMIREGRMSPDGIGTIQKGLDSSPPESSPGTEGASSLSDKSGRESGIESWSTEGRKEEMRKDPVPAIAGSTQAQNPGGGLRRCGPPRTPEDE